MGEHLELLGAAAARPGLTSAPLQVLDVPLTVKIRTGVQEKVNVAHKIIPRIREWGASMVTVWGRTGGEFCLQTRWGGPSPAL